MTLQKHLVGIVLAVGVIAISAFAQQPAGTKPSFEVATIKPNPPGDNRIMLMGQPGGRYVTHNTSLIMLMDSAYHVRDFQIVGGPGWIRTDRWNVEAKAEEGSIPPQTSLPDPRTFSPVSLMLQSLLEDRFQLKMHRETRQLPIYELVIANGGSQLKLSDDQGPIRPSEKGSAPMPPLQPGGPMPRGGMKMGRGGLEGSGVQIANLVTALSQQLGRTVIDKTDLKGLYDFKLQWTPELGQGPVLPGGPEPQGPPADSSGPSIFTALQEQLGLRLESAKGPVEVLVIDSVQKPTEN